MQEALSNFCEERLDEILCSMNLSTNVSREEKELLIRGLISKAEEESKPKVKKGRPTVKVTVDELRADKVLSACQVLFEKGGIAITQKSTIEFLKQVECILFKLDAQGSDYKKKLFLATEPRLQQSVSTGLKKLGIDFDDFRKNPHAFIENA